MKLIIDNLEVTARPGQSLLDIVKERLIRSLESAEKDKDIIVVTHYNISNNKEYLEILKKYNVKMCIFGHLHGKSDCLVYEKEGIKFMCTSCDLIGFMPVRI